MKTCFALLMGALLMVSCKSISENHPTHSGVLIVANKSDNTVNIINRSEGNILATVLTGLEPHEVEVSPDGTLAVVANYGNREFPGNSLSVIDIMKAEAVRTIDLGEHTRPHGMMFSPESNQMLVTTEGSQHVLLVDVEEGVMLKAWPTEQEISHMVAVINNPPRAFVSSIRTGNMTVIDMLKDEIISQVYSGQGAEGIAVSPDGQEVWVTNRSDNTISVFDAKHLDLLATIPCGEFPIRAKFSPDGTSFLVSNARSGEIAVIDASEKKLKAIVSLQVELSDDPEGRYFAAEFEGSSIPIGLVIPDNETAFVALTNADVIAVIDLRTFEVTGYFKTGRQPDGIAFSPLMPVF
jgi:YVTN family beta-propeller protein